MEQKIVLPELSWTPEEFKKFKKIFIVACGTAYHAGLVGKYYIEKMARIPVEVDIASEFRYRDPIIGEDCLLIVVSQSVKPAILWKPSKKPNGAGPRPWPLRT